MQNDIFGSYDEVEPRRTPKQASKFNTRPFPVVPEVSLIMDKPNQAKKMDDALPSAISDLRLSSNRESAGRSGESYAAWKEKQFPQFQNKTSPNQYQIYSSTQNSIGLHDSHAFKRDYKDYSCKVVSSDDESPRMHNVPRQHAYTDVSNKCTSSRTHRNSIDQNVNNALARNHIPRMHNSDERYIISENRYREQSYDMEKYNSRSKPKIYRSASCSNADGYNHRSLPLEETGQYHPKVHSRSLQPVHYNSEHSHCRSGCCSGSHNSSNTETETVKNLLQVITSQNEQIKNLQKQIERLLKLHEHSLKDRSHCTCQSNGIVYQNTQMYDQSRTANLPIVNNSTVDDNEKCVPDANLQDEKTKQTILEQKVSIGVMTSFELKVQNNPTLGKDNENKQKNMQEKVIPKLDTSNMIKNLVNDTGEMIRKKPNFFTYTPLENISEGSESHISSFRHSNVGPDSTRQSIGAQDATDSHNYNYRLDNQENVQKKKDSKKSPNMSNEKNTRYTPTLDYNSKEPFYNKTKTDVQDTGIYQYNLPYENLHSSPHQEVKENKTEEYNTEPLLTDIIKTKNNQFDNLADDCLSLSGSELDVDDLNPPSPEPSIHLDMQEYSSEGGSLPPQRVTKVGWTLYNNVLDQVNQILQNSKDSPDEDEDEEQEIEINKKRNKKDYDSNVIMDTVKAATLEQLTKLGISFAENVEKKEPNYNKKVVFDSFYASNTRQVPETHGPTSASLETNTSMHMKALAMKYLKEEQLADMAKQRSDVMKQMPSNVQNTNMSFATMHYLQRYQLLPGTNTSPKRESPRETYMGPGPGAVMNERLVKRTTERRVPSPQRYPQYNGASKSNYPSKILDISTLKQQPKLL